MTPELRPCPFCGGEAAMHGASYMTHKFPACTVCRAEHGDVAHWNRRSTPTDMVLVPREPTEAMLRAALDTRYGRSRRSRMVKVNFPEAYETWMRAGLAEDAPAIRDEYRAAIDAAMKEPKA